MDYTVIVGSVTYAMKAKDLLQRKGYKAYIERKTKENKSGCGYGVVTRGEKDKIESILTENKVKFSKII